MIGDLCVKPTCTPKKVIWVKTGIMGALVHLRIIVQHPQWRNFPVRNIQLVLLVVLHSMFILVLVMVKMVCYLGLTTLPHIYLIVGLVVETLCNLRLGHIHPWFIHTKKGPILHHLGGRGGRFPTDGDGRGGIGPRTTHFYPQKYMFCRYRHDGDFHKYQRQHTALPMELFRSSALCSLMELGKCVLCRWVVLNSTCSEYYD